MYSDVIEQVYTLPLVGVRMFRPDTIKVVPNTTPQTLFGVTWVRLERYVSSVDNGGRQ